MTKLPFLLNTLGLALSLLSCTGLDNSLNMQPRDKHPQLSLQETKQSLEDWIIISNAEDLQAINSNLQGYYRLGSNINLAGITWTPIGKSSPTGFQGTLDGAGFTISNLKLENITSYEDRETMTGLFTHLAEGGKICNLSLEAIDIVGNYHVAGLVGKSAGLVSNCSVKGDIYAKQNFVGGLVGEIVESGEISNSQFVGTIKGCHYVGGLVGQVTHRGGTIKNSTSDSTITTIGGKAGGLIGRNYGEIINSGTKGVIKSESSVEAIGGFVGDNRGMVKNSTSVCSVNSPQGCNVGGFVGLNYRRGTLQDCNARGDVQGENHVGGLVGNHCGTQIIRSTAAGKVVGEEKVAAQIGWNQESHYTTPREEAEMIQSLTSDEMIQSLTSDVGLINFLTEELKKCP